MKLCEYRQRTVGPRSRLAHQPVGHFLLQHQRHVRDVFAVMDEAFHDGRGGVIGQVGDHVIVLARRAVIVGQSVGLQQLEFGIVSEAFLQGVGQPRVDLQRQHRSGMFQQVLGQNALAGTDFQDPAFRRDLRELGDFGRDTGIV